MRVPLLLLSILLIVNTAIDWYIYRQVTHRCRNKKLWGRVQIWSVAALTAILVIGIFIPAKEGNNHRLLLKMWFLFSYLSVYFPKFVAVVFDLLASIPRLLGRPRIKFLTITGLTLASVLFIAIWWGALINRFNIQHTEQTIEIAGLPKSYEGYRIVQFSDLHTGTYDNDTTFVSKLVDQINAVKADVILFTGDIVNRQTSEAIPFISVLSRLKAPDGVYAILGNHDYGDYMRWDTPEAKSQNMEDLYASFRQAGIRLLRNETAWLHRGNDSIALIGVENIGDPPFPVYGSLSKAYPDITDGNTKILLTHNPAHWVDSISDTPSINVPLTLSGHTHAMQIEVAGISPAALRYRTWGGLYSDENYRHQLYVNIGAGTVGMPMRLGATPEITVLTLRRR